MKLSEEDKMRERVQHLIIENEFLKEENEKLRKQSASCDNDCNYESEIKLKEMYREEVENLLNENGNLRAEIKELKISLGNERDESDWILHEWRRMKDKNEFLKEKIGDLEILIEKKDKALQFFRSVILSGETWSPVCQSTYEYAIGSRTREEKDGE